MPGAGSLSSCSACVDYIRLHFLPASRKLQSVTVLLIGLSFLQATAAAQTNFGSIALGSSSNATVTLTIATAGTLSSISVVTQGVPALDFTNAGGGTCSTGTAYAAQATCTVIVTFSPAAAGTREGAVVLADSSGVMATGYLEGTGQAPQTAFLPGVVSTVAGGFDPSSYAVGTVNLAADAGGNVFVLNDYGEDSEGLYKETPAAGTYTQSTLLSDVGGYCIAIDGAGDFYACGGGGLNIVTLLGGAYTWTIAFISDETTAVAVDANGYVYYSDGFGAVYAPQGTIKLVDPAAWQSMERRTSMLLPTTLLTSQRCSRRHPQTGVTRKPQSSATWW